MLKFNLKKTKKHNINFNFNCLMRGGYRLGVYMSNSKSAITTNLYVHERNGPLLPFFQENIK